MISALCKKYTLVVLVNLMIPFMYNVHLRIPHYLSYSCQLVKAFNTKPVDFDAIHYLPLWKATPQKNPTMKLQLVIREICQ